MLLNFCDPRLRPKIECSAVSTDGYEVTNLISGSFQGYLAYSCIKPPVHIDIAFLCDVQLNHVLIWPAVGSQKSSGFQLYSRNTDDSSTPYALLSNGFLGPHDAGLLFYPRDVNPAEIRAPVNFLRRFIRYSVGHLTRIEVWGTVSPRCENDVVASVHALWAKRQAPLVPPVTELKTFTTPVGTRGNRSMKIDEEFEIPESFRDSITWELMTQPIILPSGNIVDQTTLENFEKSEARWCRPVSDPFTGLRFNDDRRPVLATALKSRIDKFLLDNSNENEIKRIPRVLGRDPASTMAGDRRIVQIPKCVLKNTLKRTAENINQDIKPSARKQITSNDSQCVKRYCHKLPIAVMPKQPTANAIAKSKLTKISTSSKLVQNNSQSRNRDEKLDVLTNDIFLDNNLKTLLSNMKRFNTPEKVELHTISNNCDCCKNSIFYKLPCEHVVCRKVLLSIENSQCKSCGFSYKSSEIERIHDNI